MKKIYLLLFVLGIYGSSFSQALTGTKTIGGGGDYATFNAAVADLILNGTGAGGVEFLVSPGTYAESFVIPTISGASQTSRVKFTANGGAVNLTSTGTAGVVDACITLNGADFITLDGINMANAGTSSADFCEIGVRFLTNGTTDGPSNNIVKNCTINMLGAGVITPSSRCIATGFTTITAASGAASNNKFQNLSINASERGISIIGAVGFEAVNNEISNCTIGNIFPVGTNSASNPTISGIILSANKNYKIFSNTIVSVESFNTSNTAALVGIFSSVSSGKIFNNSINRVFNNNPNANNQVFGIIADANLVGEVFVYNNFVTGVDNACNVNLNSASIIALQAQNGTGGIVNPVHFYNNTVVLTSPILKSSFTAVFGLLTNTTAHVKNNIFINGMVNSSGRRQCVFLDFNTSMPHGKLISNNNNLFASDNAFGTIGLTVTTPQTNSVTLAQWQANNGNTIDMNSVNLNPTFVSGTDFHIISGSNAGIENGGTPITQVLGDFDFQVRDLTNPDMGADEICASTSNLGSISITSDMTGQIDCGTTVTFTASVTDGGASPTLEWFLNGATVGTNSSTFVTNTLVDGDVVTCELTSSIPCNSSIPLVSNEITASVDPASILNWFQDADLDAFGNPNVFVVACAPPAGFILDNTDCNDADLAINPNATETCDGIDNNCLNGADDGLVFEDYFSDLDNDFFGGAFISNACTPPAIASCDGIYTITISGTGFMDEVGYTMFDASNNVVSAGANFGTGSTNIFEPNLTNGPFTFNIETQGSFNDNDASFSVTFNGTTLTTGALDGGQSFSAPNLCGGGVVLVTTVSGDCDDNNVNVNPAIAEINGNSIDDNCNGLTDEITQVIAAQCNTTLPFMTKSIVADELIGAANYKFRVINGTDTNFVTTPNRFFYITSIPNFQYSTTYQVAVATQFGFFPFSDFGPTCTITTPDFITQIRNSQCGATLTGLNSVLANILPGAVEYKFRVNFNGYEQIVTTPLYFLTFASLDSAGYNRIYSIDVAARLSGSPTFGNFGPVCLINTGPAPLTQVQASQCNGTLSSITNNIIANSVLLATQYKFRVSLGPNVQEIIKPTRVFNMSMFTGFAFGTTYTVEVASFVNGAWTLFGNSCNITTPAAGSQTSQLEGAFCGFTVNNLSQSVNAVNVFAATEYEFKVENALLGFSQTVVKPNRVFKFSFLTGIIAGTTYQVSVRAKTGGVFGNFGNVCNLSTPGIAPTMQNAETTPAVSNELNVSAFPSPFAQTFTLNISSESTEPVFVRVYDMNGKMLEVRNIQTSEAKILAMGENLAAGIYQVTVTQGDKVKTLKVIKTLK